MKKNSSSLKARVLAGIPFLLTGVVLLVLSTTYGANRKFKPSSQRPVISPSLAVPVPFSGTYDPTTFPCATPRNTFIVPPGQARIIVQVTATVPTNDLTVTLLYGVDPNPVVVAGPEDTGISTELLLFQPSGGVAAGEYQVQVCETPNPGALPQTAPFTYNGTFTTDNTAPAGGAPPPKTFNVAPAALDNGAKIGFENFPAPGVLTQVKTTEAGQQPNSFEYLGRNAGEPSIGDNWLTDTAVYASGLETLFVKFDDSCPANGLSSTWANRAALTQIAVDSDPIGFTDPVTGRSFTGQLTLLSPSCKTSYTDDDGQTWIPTQGSGIASGVDHETIGGGIYHAPIPSLPTPYNHAVYYCSQEGEPGSGPPSFCSRSDDGGLTFGPSVPLTTPPVNVCGGLHGHVKVSPQDGTVYVPFNTCDGVGSAIVSEDNGVSWTIRHVQNGTVSVAPSASFQDPAISIDANGRVYFIIANNDTQAVIATSDDHGQTWQNLANVSDIYGLKNIRYPAAIAGDQNRAAVAFYGTKTAGDALQPGFNGVWHLYVAHTFDGGSTWTTTDATPNAPMQRGCIWAKGGANICRNLLDFFDMTVDKNGRVLVGYINGCEGGNCVQAPLTVLGETPSGQGNGYTSAATIARQSSGRRLIGNNNLIPGTSKPGTPWLTQKRVGNVVNLQWSEADTGNLMINNYEIRRGTAPGGESFLTTVSGTQVGGSYNDVLPANDTTTYYYKIVANSSGGASCGNNEVPAPYLGTACTGILIHRNDPTHPEANAGALTPASLLIDYVAVGEPENTSNLMFKMKVNDLSTVPPNSRWRMTWNSFTSPGQQYYVGMTSGASGPPTFEYGTLADAGVPAVFVISEKNSTPALPASNFTPDGTITIYVPKSVVGNPQVGALLGAVSGRTLTGDNGNCATDIPPPAPCTPNNQVERSNAFVDHTFVKAQSDNSFPASTYTVLGNNACSATGLAPIGAVSRKIHGSAGTFDIDLPLSGQPGIECRTGGPSGNHRVVVTFPAPVTVASATCGANPAAALTTNASVVTVDCTGVPNAQTINITLNTVSDGTNTATISIPMGVLEGDTTANGRVNSSDISQTQSQSGQPVDATNFREDVTVNGFINSSDISVVQSRSGTALP
jgi:hypothetical protein